jgi:hypothetical protein
MPLQLAESLGMRRFRCSPVLACLQCWLWLDDSDRRAFIASIRAEPARALPAAPVKGEEIQGEKLHVSRETLIGMFRAQTERGSRFMRALRNRIDYRPYTLAGFS